jgi:pSer/pThr/pTyr-binding forkhead associated (FHA) protein
MVQSRIVLSVASGDIGENEFVFDSPSRCVIGRAIDCEIHIPGSTEHGFVSRHHCMLDIQPPLVRVRDLGSLNGTYINGRMIGHRNPGRVLEDAFQITPLHKLRDGDELRVGTTVFRIVISKETDGP